MHNKCFDLVAEVNFVEVIEQLKSCSLVTTSCGLLMNDCGFNRSFEYKYCPPDNFCKPYMKMKTLCHTWSSFFV